MMASCLSISSRRRKPCDPSFEDVRCNITAVGDYAGVQHSRNWVRPNYLAERMARLSLMWGARTLTSISFAEAMAFGRPRIPAYPVGKSCFHSSRESASPWPTPAVMHLASSPRQDARNCAGADTVSYVRAGCRELTRPLKFQAKASEYSTIKGLGARLTGGSSQEPAAR
jgi:hypothetical protein